MMCGDKAHGDIRIALKSGGCGQTFKWSTLEKISTTIIDFQGERVNCDPVVRFKAEIAAFKKANGLVTSVEEEDLAATIVRRDGRVVSRELAHGSELLQACQRWTEGRRDGGREEGGKEGEGMGAAGSARI